MPIFLWPLEEIASKFTASFETSIFCFFFDVVLTVLMTLIKLLVFAISFQRSSWPHGKISSKEGIFSLINFFVTATLSLQIFSRVKTVDPVAFLPTDIFSSNATLCINPFHPNVYIKTCWFLLVSSFIDSHTVLKVSP